MAGNEEMVIDILLMAFVVIIGLVMMGVLLYCVTRRGEDCPGYPYNCTYCRHAAECIIEISQKHEAEKNRSGECRNECGLKKLAVFRKRGGYQ